MNGKDFAAKHGFTMTATQVPENPHMVSDARSPMFHWYCTLSINNVSKGSNKGMTLYFSKGAAHVGYKRAGEWVRASHEEQRKAQQYAGASYAERCRACGVVKDLQPIPAQVGEVLQCLAMDFSSVANASSFEDWARDMGSDTDSRAALRSYDTIREQAGRFMQSFGLELYRELLTVQDA